MTGSQLYFFLHAFVSGVLAYAEYGLCLAIFGVIAQRKAATDLHFLATLVDSKQPLAYAEILWVCVLAVVNGFAFSALINRNFLNKIARWLRTTKRFGNYDVWGYVCNSPKESLRWVRIRDHRHDVCYEGWIEAYSDTNAGCELLLREVRTFKNESGEFLYEVPCVYVSQDPKDVTIEFYALDVRGSTDTPHEGEADACRE